MTEKQKKKMIWANTIYWLAAMVMPGVMHLIMEAFASENARFPWPILIPFLYFGLLLSSNKLLTTAIGETTEG